MRISVCIATYRRPASLRKLLNDLCAQERLPTEVIVVDNDMDLSALPVVSGFQAPFPLRYGVQPQKNIALTRNCTTALARGDYLAFIDDDERAPPDWLETLANAAVRYLADAVQGPVVPQLPAEAPAWIRRGRFHDYPRLLSGVEVPLNRLRLGNLLVRRAVIEAAGSFDPAYGLTGGEDGDLLSRVAALGARIVWCDEAVVFEPVVEARLSLNWLLRRALRGGQDFARHSLAGRYGPMGPAQRAQFILRAAAQLVLAIVLSLAVWPFGRHRGVRWLLAASANLGKLSLFWGLHYREYA